jgi:hypothetical protein
MGHWADSNWSRQIRYGKVLFLGLSSHLRAAAHYDLDDGPASKKLTSLTSGPTTSLGLCPGPSETEDTCWHAAAPGVAATAKCSPSNDRTVKFQPPRHQCWHSSTGGAAGGGRAEASAPAAARHFFSQLENGSPACGQRRKHRLDATFRVRRAWTFSSMASHGISSRCRRRLEKGNWEGEGGRKQGRHTLVRSVFVYAMAVSAWCLLQIAHGPVICSHAPREEGGDQRRGQGQSGGSFCE